MTLPAERYARLRELFHQLVDLAAEQRAERLAGLANTEADLAAELADLLAVDATDARWGAAFGCGPSNEPGAEVSSLIGRRAGPWQVDRLIGHGGMGSVFLAHRADGAFTQEVALKLIRGSLATPQLVRRFRDERQVLAQLGHPNIARLLDGGTTEDGLPYLVMEHVLGSTLEEHCTAHDLGLAARLELFLAICAAVDHAHRNLVVHRDLKPGNVLVTDDGVPKLLDFGIAKLLDRLPSDETLLTLAHTTVGTVAFASPEQLGGEAVTTATDVYSLGVVLYRLLAGCHPYALSEVALPEAVRRVRESVPLPPSRAVLDGATDAAARKRAHALRGDLDTIVLCALQKDPDRRYASAAALAEDLQRHRKGLPIHAHPPGVAYRAARFLGRHRLAMTAAALVTLSLAGGVVATVLSANRAREAARRAELERAKASQVSGFLADMFSAGNVGWRVRAGRGVTVGELLANASERLGKDLRSQPAVEARLRHILGESEVALAEYEPATRDLERALDLDLHLYGDRDAQTARARSLLGWMRLNAGDQRRGVPLLDAALATYRRLPDPPPADFAEALGFRGYAAAAVEARPALGESLARESVALARRRLAGQALLPICLGGLGVAETANGDTAGAERTYREALAEFARLPDPDLPERHHVLLYLGMLVARRGALDEAEPLLREALDITDRRLGPEDVLAVEPHLELGRLYFRRGDDARAEVELRRGLAIQGLHTATDHPMTAKGNLYLGEVLLRQRRDAEAERVLRASLAVFPRFPSLRGLEIETETVLADCLTTGRRYAEAAPLAGDALARARATDGDRAAPAQAALRVLVRLYAAWGKPALHDQFAARLLPPPAPPS
jgi:tetratricopeptide (TPR) repeat protein